MKKTILLAPALIFALSAFSQEYIPVDDGSSVKFTIKNFGLTVTGSFTRLKGKMFFDPANPAVCSLLASVEPATVNTGNNSRDNHLKKEEYFDVEKYPLISFVSTKITGSPKAGTFLLEGKITVKGITKPVSFPFSVTPRGDSYLFEGEFKLNRRDFEVGGSSLVMSDNLTVSLSVLAKKRIAAP